MLGCPWHWFTMLGCKAGQDSSGWFSAGWAHSPGVFELECYKVGMLMMCSFLCMCATFGEQGREQLGQHAVFSRLHPAYKYKFRSCSWYEADEVARPARGDHSPTSEAFMSHVFTLLSFAFALWGNTGGGQPRRSRARGADDSPGKWWILNDAVLLNCVLCRCPRFCRKMSRAQIFA